VSHSPIDILVLSHLVPWPTTSGVLLRCYNLLREVARHHRVHLLALNQEVLLAPDEVEASRRHLAAFCTEVQVFPLAGQSSRVAYGGLLLRNLASSLPYSVPRFYSPDLEHAMIELLARKPIRVLQFETIAMAQYGALAPDLPAILVHQNVESDLIRRRAASERNPLARLYLATQADKLARYEERMCRAVSANVAVSAADRAAFLGRIPGIRCDVVVNGVDVDYFRPAGDPAGNGDRLVFVGGMSWYPNRDAMSWFLAEIWPRIRHARPEARMTIVGSHPSPEVRRAVASGERITAPGLVADIRPYVDPAAVYVCPLRVGGGTRLKILDAWAMGKAVVSTAVGCEGLTAESGREIEIADDPAAFAERVVTLLADPARRRALGRAGRERAVAEFAWPRVAGGMLRLVDELAAEHVGVGLAARAGSGSELG
jgi:sugar transferase (PEP-CTERM/EpsH1 system associated)